MPEKERVLPPTVGLEPKPNHSNPLLEALERPLAPSLCWGPVLSREISPQQWQIFEQHVAEIFSALGLDLDTPGTRRTPERFLGALFDCTAGYEGDPNLLTVFPAETANRREAHLDQVVEGPIQFFALCEHHALPFFGEAYVGYVPRELIIGISKLTRLVRLYAGRFTVQERMGAEIADALMGFLEPRGVAVHLQATHLCTQMRGVRETASETSTSFWRGDYSDDPALRGEFLARLPLGWGAGRP